LQTKYELFDN